MLCSDEDEAVAMYDARGIRTQVFPSKDLTT
jgi:hypothetical protein